MGRSCRFQGLVEPVNVDHRCFVFVGSVCVAGQILPEREEGVQNLFLGYLEMALAEVIRNGCRRSEGSSSLVGADWAWCVCVMSECVESVALRHTDRHSVRHKKGLQKCRLTIFIC